jgi:hypothetical protein
VSIKIRIILCLLIFSGMLVTAAQAPEYTHIPSQQVVYWTPPAGFGEVATWSPPEGYKWEGGPWQPPEGWVAPTRPWTPPEGWGVPKKWEAVPEFR